MGKWAITIGAGLVGIAIGIGGTLVLLRQERPVGPERSSAVLRMQSTIPQKAATTNPGPALEALQTLRSVTGAGVTYQSYSERVRDARIRVDRYLREAGPSDVAREPIDLAMRYYVAASTAWSMKITNRGETIARLAAALGDDPRLSECLVIKSIPQDKEIRGYHVVALNIPPFWECASAKVAEAERLVAAEK